MPLKIDLGPAGAIALNPEGDLAKFLKPSIDSIVKLPQSVLALSNGTVAQIPSTVIGGTFSFSTQPEWKVSQSVGISLGVSADAKCTLSFIKPGDELFSYSDADGTETKVTSTSDQYYISIAMQVSIGVDAGANFSSGNFGVSGSASTSHTFRIANFYSVPGSAKLADAIAQAFSAFVLPFQADADAQSVRKLPDGDFIEFEFEGKLALGFGVTYGFSGLFLGGNTAGEVQSSVATPIGKALVKVKPSFNVGANFKMSYEHYDAFRVIVGRTKTTAKDGATLYLLRKKRDELSASEKIGITFNAGAKFQVEPTTIKNEVLQSSTAWLGPQAGPLLAGKINQGIDSGIGKINDSVNSLLAKGDGHKVELELQQSRTKENTALFVYHFDFSHPQAFAGYANAMRGDYVSAISMEGVTLDPGSYIERLYTSKAGLTFQFFSLLKFHELTQYIHQVDAIYIGDRTFQLRTTTGVKDVAGLFGKEREADLFFVANCKEIAGQQAVSGVVINLSCVFLDSSNRDAFAQSQKLATALQLKDAANAIASYVHDHPNGKVKLTIEGPAQVFTGLRADSYVGNKPPKEPHNLDRSNYDAFVSALRTLAKQDDAAAGEFFKNFATYQDWLDFNRVKTDQQGSTKPGDRLNVGNLANSVWPENHGPSDLAARSIVQQHVLAGQAFMNLCEALKQISDTAGTITTEAQYDSFLDQIRHMIPKDVYWPAYFLKPTMVALIHLLSAKVVADSSVTKDGDCSIKVTLSLGSGAGAGHD